MQGFQITVFTQQDRRHHGKPLVEWLVQLAGELGLSGATVMPATEGIGHHHRVHAAHFFELADQPMAVLFVLTEDEAQRLTTRLAAEGLQLFYVKTAVEFGVIGKEA